MTKNSKWIIAVLAVLVVLVLINLMSQKKYSTQTAELFSVKPDDLYGIVIEKEDELLELVRVDTTWQIKDHDSLVVKRQVLDRFFNRVLDLKRESVVSKNPEKWEKFSVDDSTGTFLSLLDYSGATLGSCVFGRSKSDYSRNYVRFNDDPNVYQTSENIIFQLQTRPTYWGEIPKPEVIEPDSTEVSEVNL